VLEAHIVVTQAVWHRPVLNMNSSESMNDGFIEAQGS
jgi:hypothetical protein